MRASTTRCRRGCIAGFLLLAIVAALVAPATVSAQDSSHETPATSAKPATSEERDDDKPDGFLRAEEPIEWMFPRDHGAHPRYRTEWWYLTGALRTDDGELLGYQATWFRSALVAAPPRRESPLATRDLFFFHGALSDVARGTHRFADRVARGTPAWAGATSAPFRVQVWNDTLELLDDGRFTLRMRVDGRELALSLSSERKPLLHGEQPGLSRKGPEPGQSSYYASLTRLSVSGTLTDEDGRQRAVTGMSWFDHEFGSDQLADDRAGWDWFSVALEDGTDLMLYVLRRKDGTLEPASSGTIRGPDGSRRHLRLEDFEVVVHDRWKSPRSSATYPGRWTLRVPSASIELEVEPLIADQELDTRSTTGITYWEGLTRFRGRTAHGETSGLGYVELVGYAAAFGAGI